MSQAPLPDSVSGDAPPMPSSFDDNPEFWEEGRVSKIWRRLKEEPLVPVGLALTCYALYQATMSIRRGDKTSTNRYFRARVYAQGFTLLCIVVGSVYWKEDREKRKYYQGLLGEKKAAERRDAWIKELEARDEEDRAERERRQRRRQALQEGSSTNSGMEEEDLRRMVLGSKILGPAMWIWKMRRDD